MTDPEITLKKDTRSASATGKKLVNREKAEWVENDWILDGNTRWIFTRQGMRQVTITDYFGRYDFLAAWPAAGIMALVQVSAASPGAHKPPLGFASPLAGAVWGDSPDDLLKAPKDNPADWRPGVHEVYVYYRKLKSAKNPRAWQADRRWWLPP